MFINIEIIYNVKFFDKAVYSNNILYIIRKFMCNWYGIDRIKHILSEELNVICKNVCEIYWKITVSNIKTISMSVKNIKSW